MKPLDDYGFEIYSCLRDDRIEWRDNERVYDLQERVMLTLESSQGVVKEQRP